MDHTTGEQKVDKLHTLYAYVFNKSLCSSALIPVPLLTPHTCQRIRH